MRGAFFILRVDCPAHVDPFASRDVKIWSLSIPTPARDPLSSDAMPLVSAQEAKHLSQAESTCSLHSGKIRLSYPGQINLRGWLYAAKENAS
ncbi:hypothetical protein P170DRAFT_42791 [Aspergillus steynii IBT 23096]|uniref:Uncharacterized protein n=1 Tax=Aspergillus steynii IBT 23096 TaxID=1392250 RepID=A0A2I2GRM2_9EURO|nr:uncharacterized protein P170DRAFT_42791 [Aspergillus steynii IBT 23096]PLB55504.1 hypothetical protein P170DRAFT_42791 [Aspergillus steynii IBT 23096]